MNFKFCLFVFLLIFCISVSNVSAATLNDTDCLKINDVCENLTFDDEDVVLPSQEATDNMQLSNNDFPSIDDELLLSEDNSSLIRGNLVKVYGNDTNFTFYFYDNTSSCLANSEVFFSFMGQKHSFYTDNEGCVNLQVDWNPGEYYILIENPATQDLCLKKINILPQIESTDLVKQYKNTTSFTVRILGLDGLPVSAGKTVTFRNGIL